jgi:hypothetical protein
VDQSASNTGNEQRVVDLELDGVLELLVALCEHGIETLSLGDSSGETIENEAAARIVSFCCFADHRCRIEIPQHKV